MSKIKWKKTINANFQTDLARGRIGELAFLHATNGTLNPTDGKSGDYVISGTRTKVELKSDYYNADNTENFFFEIYRSGNRPGGAHQALEHGCKYFLYCYVPNAAVFCFETKALVERLELLHDSKNITLTSVGNGSYTTRGMKVNRDLVTDLMIELSDIGVNYDSKKYEWYRDFNKSTPE
jgi:hypothetical protein